MRERRNRKLPNFENVDTSVPDNYFEDDFESIYPEIFGTPEIILPKDRNIKQQQSIQNDNIQEPIQKSSINGIDDFINFANNVSKQDTQQKFQQRLINHLQKLAVHFKEILIIIALIKFISIGLK